jgi:hypothetical protein
LARMLRTNSEKAIDASDSIITPYISFRQSYIYESRKVS